MTAVLLVLALVALLVCGLRLRALRSGVEQLEKIVAQIARERRPASFLLRGSPALVRTALDLEKISDHQHTLARRAAEEAFNLRAVLAGMAEGVAVLDAGRKIRLANDSLRKLFSIDSDPMGKTVLVALREAAVEEIAAAALKSGETQTREISLARQGSTESLHLAIGASPIADPSGATRGVVLVFHDISRLRQLEEIRKQFVSNVSHELRTPLSIFQGYVENLLDNPGLPEAQLVEILHVLQRHSQRLNAILEDLLTLARLESRADELEMAEIDLPAFVRQFMSDWAIKFTKKHIAISLDIGVEKLRADRSRLEQIFANLIDNAIRYVPAESGRIAISAQSRGGFVELRVQDNGPGIPANDLPHIFERFYRVEKARSRERGGTGLGLSIVKHIVALHGGSVRAESRLGEGTTIVIELPR